jgi:hypothetical protein
MLPNRFKKKKNQSNSEEGCIIRQDVPPTYLQDIAQLGEIRRMHHVVVSPFLRHKGKLGLVLKNKNQPR